MTVPPTSIAISISSLINQKEVVRTQKCDSKALIFRVVAQPIFGGVFPHGVIRPFLASAGVEHRSPSPLGACELASGIACCDAPSGRPKGGYRGKVRVGPR